MVACNVKEFLKGFYTQFMNTETKHPWVYMVWLRIAFPEHDFMS